MTETADTIAIRIVAETETAERRIADYGANLRRTMAGVEVAVTRAAESTEAATRRQHAAYRDLGTALVKVSADAIDGKNAFRILGEQGTAVAAAMVGLGGSVGRVAGLLAGPWGVALTTAVSVIGLLATKGGEAAAGQDRAATAVDRLKTATEALNAVAAVNFSNNAHSIRQMQQGIALTEKQTQAIRDRTRSELTDMRAKVLVAKAIGPLAGVLMGSFYGGDIAAAESKLAELDKLIGSGAQARRDGDFRLALDRASAALDPLEAARQAHDDVLQQIKAAYDGKVLGKADLDAQVAQAERRYAEKVARLTKPQPARPLSAPSTAASRERAPSPAEIRAANYDDAVYINLPTLDIPSEVEAMQQLYDAAAALAEFDATRFEIVDPEQLAAIGKISAALRDDLAKSLVDAIAAGTSLGDALVDAFARAGKALIQSQITRLLDPRGDGSTGFVKSATDAFAAVFGARTPPKRASGGHVSAGRLYRVNEAGIEGFRPAGSGTIVPLGQMAAARPTGGVTVVQPLNVSFAGAITTPELMAQFKAYADGVGQAAVIGGAAMAQAKLARRAARALPR